MAKAKLRKPRKKSDLVATSELYTHSSPPKVVNGSGTQKIREYVRTGNISALEEILLSGNGQSLVNQPSTDKTVRAFLKTVPSYMSKIDLVHDAVERGNLRDLKALLDRRKLSRSKDKQGIGLLQKAVLCGHRQIADYLITEYPESLEVKDKDGRNSLHYAAASKNPEEMYNFLSNKVDDADEKDAMGKSASYYMQHPAELSGLRKEALKNYIEHKKKRSPVSKKNSPNHKAPVKREGLNITGANIRIWIHDEDLPKLEKIVWEGQGHRLTNETSNNPRVRQFLRLVPKLMMKIKEVNQATINRDFDALEAKVEQPDILVAKDQNGLNPLHRAAALGHYGICKWIVIKNPATVHGIDKKGRSPLHYASIPTDGGDIYNLLVKNGADPNLLDQSNKTPDDYRGRPGEIDMSTIYQPPSAPRIGGSTDYRPSKMNSNATSRATSPSYRHRSLDRINKNKGEMNGDSKNHKKLKKNKDKMVYVDMSKISQKEIDEIVQDGDLEKLEQIILSGRGPDLNGKTSWNDEVRRFLKKAPGYTDKVFSLHDAANAGHLQEVKRLVDENPKLAMARSLDGEVALHYAAKAGNDLIAEYLLEIYPDALHATDSDCRTPAHWAALSSEAGSPKVYSIFEKLGSDMKLQDDNGKSPSDYFREMTDSISTERTSDTSISNSHSMDRMPKVASPSGDKHSSRSSSQDPRQMSKKLSKSRSPSKTRGRSKSRSRSKERKLSKSRSRSNDGNISRSSSRNRSGNNKYATTNGHVSPRDNMSNKKSAHSKEQSRPSSGIHDDSVPHSRPTSPNNNVSNGDREKSRPSSSESHYSSKSYNGDTEFDDESREAIKLAEDGDFESITSIIIRGDGQKLLLAHSENKDVQHFIKELPSLLKSLQKIRETTENGDLRSLQNLLDRKDKARTKDSNGSNLLHLAVLHGHTDIVRYLAQYMPKLMNEQDKAGRTPSHYASSVRDGGHIYKILTKGGANVQIKDAGGYTAQDYIQNPGFLTQSELYEELQEGLKSSDVEAKTEEDYKHSAYTEGSDGTDEVGKAEEFYLEHSGNPELEVKEENKRETHQTSEGEEADSSGMESSPTEFPGMWSDEGKYLSEAFGDILVKALAIVNEIRPSNPVAELAVALYTLRFIPQRHKNALPMVTKTSEAEIPGSGNSKDSTIVRAAAFGNNTNKGVSKTDPAADSIPLIIMTDEGENILHFAAAVPHQDTILYRLILTSGASLAARNSNFETPRDVAMVKELYDNVGEIDDYILHLAADGKTETLKTLVLEGYDSLFEVEDIEGLSIADVSRISKQAETEQFLLGVPEFQERRDFLQRAIRVGSMAHVEFIADSEDVARAKDTKGRTALHIAVLCEQKEIISFLNKKYPSLLTIGDNAGRTPLHYGMAVEGADEIAKLLVKAGAEKTVKDMSGKLPSYYFMNRSDIVGMVEEMYKEDDSSPGKGL